MFNNSIGLPSSTFTDSLAIIFTFLGACALTRLVRRKKIPEDPDFRPMIVYDTIKERSGVTLAELQKLTGHSRGSLSVNLHRLALTKKIRKSVRDNKSRHYVVNAPDDDIKEFWRKIAAQEKSQKIFETIISMPGISQKELHETTGIPKTTLQWHLSQLVRYDAIKSTREKNTLHYSTIPDYILLYTYILEEGKQKTKTNNGLESNSRNESQQISRFRKNHYQAKQHQQCSNFSETRS